METKTVTGIALDLVREARGVWELNGTKDDADHLLIELLEDAEMLLEQKENEEMSFDEEDVRKKGLDLMDGVDELDDVRFATD